MLEGSKAELIDAALQPCRLEAVPVPLCQQFRKSCRHLPQLLLARRVQPGRGLILLRGLPLLSSSVIWHGFRVCNVYCSVNVVWHGFKVLIVYCSLEQDAKPKGRAKKKAEADTGEASPSSDPAAGECAGGTHYITRITAPG
jgi:hypothetical protein